MAELTHSDALAVLGQALNVSSFLTRDFCESCAPGVYRTDEAPMTFEQLLARGMTDGERVESSLLDTIRQESQQDAKLLSKTFKATDTNYQSLMFCQADVDYIRYTLNQLEVDSVLTMAVSEFMKELEQFLPDEKGKKLAACLKAATARISESGRTMAANLGRILPTGPRRMSKTLFLKNEFSGCHKALLLRAFYKM